MITKIKNKVQEKSYNWGISKFNMFLAVIISLIGIFQFVNGISNSYAKSTVVCDLKIEMRIGFLQNDERYYQNQIWAMQDRYGFDNLESHNASLPPAVVNRYREYKMILSRIKEELSYLKSKFYQEHGFGAEVYKYK